MDSTRQLTDYYTITEAAKVLGVHYETAARWVRSGKLGSVRLSRRKVLVPKQECRALITRSAGGSEQAPAGAPHRWLFLAGTLTEKEASKLRAAARVYEEVEKVD